MLWLLRKKMIGRLGPCASALILGMTLLPIFPALAANASDERENVGVACLGRILPEDGIFHISAPYTLQGPSLIAQVLVKEGDWVKKDQVLAATRSRPIAEAACAEAKSQVEVARARLAQVQAGEKASDIAAQEAEVQRSNADFRDAELIFNRNQQLRKTGAVSDAELDHSRSTFEGRRNQMESATKKLASIREVRQTDVNYAAALVTAAIAAAQRLEAELDQTYLRAPVDGQIIKIHTSAGEQAGPLGVLELAKTQSMFVIAEVYETDIRRVKESQRAEISAEFLGPKVTGMVERIGLAVARNDIYKTDPAAFSDARIVEVKIRLDDSATVAGLTGAQVNVRILP